MRRAASFKAGAVLAALVGLLAWATWVQAGALDDVDSNLAGDNIASGLAAQARGDHDGAIARFTMAINSNALDKENRAIAYNDRGNAYDDKGDDVKALADYDQALRLNPAFSEAYYNRALLLHRQGRFQEALRDYSRLLSLNPYLASGYFNRSFTWASLGQYDKAVADVEKALELSPGNSKYMDQLRDWKSAQSRPAPAR